VRVPELLGVPAAVRFVSCEPLLGRIDLWATIGRFEAAGGEVAGWTRDHPTYLDWVIVGGESGPRARPMHPEWARELRDECVVSGVPYFFKQVGEWTTEYPQGRSLANMAESYECGQAFYRVGKAAAGELLDGKAWHEVPGQD
jgi:protein gp37